MGDSRIGVESGLPFGVLSPQDVCPGAIGFHPAFTPTAVECDRGRLYFVTRRTSDAAISNRKRALSSGNGRKLDAKEKFHDG
jgi:hypothetical protein